MALIQTPHRFRTKRHLWIYSDLALERHDRTTTSKIFSKGAATRVSGSRGPLRDFYENLLEKKPALVRLTLARKIAAITLIVWKKEVRCDANYWKPQAI